MLGSTSLEIAIGIAFVYLSISLVCTSVMEGIASVLNKRGKTLFEGLKNLLNDPQFTGLAQQLYSHGLVSGISEFASDPNQPNRLPSYMPSKIVSSALVDILSSTGAAFHPCWNRALSDCQQTLKEASAAAAANPGNASLAAAAVTANSSLNNAQAMLNEATGIIQQIQLAAKTAEQADMGKNFKDIQTAAQQFAVALNDGRALAAQIPDPLESIENGVRNHVPAGHTRDSLLLLVEKARRQTAAFADKADFAERRIEAFQTNIDMWYSHAMDRVTGWYKRWTQVILIVISAFAVIAANADTIMLVQTLAANDTLRTALTGVAAQVVRAAPPAATPASDASAATPASGATAATPANGASGVEMTALRTIVVNRSELLGLPVGWTLSKGATTDFPTRPLDWCLKIVGLILSIAAVSLGAPFWFDTLSKFVNIRGAGTPPGQQNKSGPRQKPAK
ncbi:hypothetical protein [Paraburkholderia sp. J7]|uniref:hypothetical protein n=1 Tax=Paraburkholderia sp. J7 TaxID=2805438 RepID=UPI002AB708A8|nr:hypothetical protein [Paraburkholderia sp. J7]